jgi:hypothetical protein
MNSYPTLKEKITDFSKLSLNTNRKLKKIMVVLISVSCECCVLSGIGLQVRMITHIEESYPVCCV